MFLPIRGVQIASAKGYRVVAIDSGEKEEICKRSGAVEFINMREQKVWAPVIYCLSSNPSKCYRLRMLSRLALMV